MGGPLREHLPHQQLVGGVLERVEEADRDRLHALGEELVHRRLGRFARERNDDLPARVDPLLHLDPEIALDELRRLLPPEVVEARHAKVPELEHVAEAARRDEAGERPLVLEDRVGRDRRAVPDLRHVRPGEGGLVEDLRETARDRLRVVLDARGHLAGEDPAPGVEEHDVGEGSADVDTDAIAVHGRASPLVRYWRFRLAEAGRRDTVAPGAGEAGDARLGVQAPGRLPGSAGIPVRAGSGWRGTLTPARPVEARRRLEPLLGGAGGQGCRAPRKAHGTPRAWGRRIPVQR